MALEHKGTVKIETSRLILRRFTPEDKEPIYQNCWSDREVWKWMNYAPMDCIGDLAERSGLFTEKWFAAYERPDRYSWAIQLRETGEVIGRFFGMHPDDRLEQVELAYELGRKWWNMGYMTEAASAVIDFFFSRVGMNRVWAYHADANPASGKVLQKCGMKYEGTLRQACICNNGRFDMVCYSILAEEYAARNFSGQ